MSVHFVEPVIETQSKEQTMNKPDVRTLYKLAVEADCDLRTLRKLLNGDPRERLPRASSRAKLILIRDGYLPNDDARVKIATSV